MGQEILFQSFLVRLEEDLEILFSTHLIFSWQKQQQKFDNIPSPQTTILNWNQ